MSFLIDNQDNSIINLNLNIEESPISSDIFGGMGKGDINKKKPSSSSRSDKKVSSEEQSSITKPSHRETRTQEYKNKKYEEVTQEKIMKRRVTENDILTIIVGLFSQKIGEKGNEQRIVTGLNTVADKNKPERRLLSNINFKKNKNMIEILSAEHVVPIDIFILNGVLHVINTQEFSNGKSKSMLEQIMKFNPSTGSIQFTLEERNKNFNYVSKYNVDIGEKKIKLNPYTEEEHRKIVPISKLKIIKGNFTNIYKFLNEMEPSNPVTIDSKYDELIGKLKRIRIEKAKELVSKDKELKTVEHHLYSKRTRQIFDSNLKLWKNNFDEWTWYKDKIMPIEQHDIRFTYEETKEPPKISNQMAKIIENVQPYDSRIKLEKVMDRDYYKAVNYGVYAPYLVSYILRYKQVNYYDATVDALCLTKDNIEEFAKFIHRFKSACFSIISLYYQLIKRLEKPCIEINYRVGEIYKGFNDNQSANIIEHKLLFSPDESPSNSIKILKPSSEKVGEEKKGLCDVDSIDELKLDEPLYGNEEFSRIKDFDQMYMENLNQNRLSGLFDFFKSNIKSNFDLFYEDKFGLKQIIEETNKDITENEEIDLEKDFPSLDKPIEPIIIKNLGAWGSPLIVKEPVKQIVTKPEDKPIPKTIPKSTPFRVISTPVYDSSKSKSKDDDYYQKYLKYKNKYIQLKNKFNL